MAHLTFTKKMATKLKINTSSAVEINSQDFASLDDWIVDTVWDAKRDPWVMFYHKLSTFAVIIQPEKYKLDNCINLFLMLVQELLMEYNLETKMYYFMDLFKDAKICKNNDRSSTAYMTQNKVSAYCGLENPHEKYRIKDLYSLMIYVNDMLRKKFDNKKTSLEVFLTLVRDIQPKINLEHTAH